MQDILSYVMGWLTWAQDQDQNLECGIGAVVPKLSIY